jgi:TatD DNase family protein
MIDTHVHFNSKGLSGLWREALDRASAIGVEKCVVVGYDLGSSARGVELAETDPRLWATVGIHPHDATSFSDEILEKLRAWLAHPRVVALGEIGLDFYRDLSPRPDQYRAFSAQLALAHEFGSTVILHCRDAYDECLEVLEAEAQGLTVILHCFLGDRAQAERAWKRGWFIGVDGPVTYKKNDDLPPGSRRSRFGASSPTSLPAWSKSEMPSHGREAPRRRRSTLSRPQMRIGPFRN